MFGRRVDGLRLDSVVKIVQIFGIFAVSAKPMSRMRLGEVALSGPIAVEEVNTMSQELNTPSNVVADQPSAEHKAARTKPDPVSEYESRLKLRRQAVAELERSDNRIAMARGLTFSVAVAIAWLAFYASRISGWWLSVPVVVFLLLVVIHARTIVSLRRARRAVAYYQQGLARLADRWIGSGPTGERYIDHEHPYSSDLDLFGRGSLFQLLSRAQTRLGEDTLSEWLTHPAGSSTVHTRQTAVRELMPQLDFREELALLDASTHDKLDHGPLIEWAQEKPTPVSPTAQVAAGILSFAAIVALVAWIFSISRLSVLLVILMLEIVFLFSFRKRIRSVAKTVEQAGAGLAILAKVLDIIEREQFETPYLGKLRQALDTEGKTPSQRIERLHKRIQSLNNSLQNQFFAPFALLLCLPVHLVQAIEAWRSRYGPEIPKWLHAVGDVEAVLSLAGHAYERPTDIFPEIIEGGPEFSARAIGHPLLPDERCVRNDITFGTDVKLMMVSGSNMSGKSTLLRSIGTNAVMALAGGTVRARQLRLSPFVIGTSMRVHDSLQEGESLFYAAISGIKRVVELAGSDPALLFLLDEILQGTNSHDRRVGAEGIIRQLVDRGAVGLVTTHDLALTDIVNALGDSAINVHFEDRIKDGKMVFDYQMRPGVVQRSNALQLMRMVGLDVDQGRSSDS